MMRQALLALLLAIATPMAAVDVKTCAVRLRVQPDGSASGRIQLQLRELPPGAFELPFGIVGALDLQVEEGPRGAGAALVLTGGQPRLRISVPEAPPGEATLILVFHVAQVYSRPEAPKGSRVSTVRLLKHTFVNTLEAEIGEYRFEALLPADFRVQAIREQLPKPGKAEAEPRVRLGRIEGLQSATLRCGPMRQGDDTTMTLEITSARRSWGWLVAGCAAALLYLIRFRDTLAPPAPESCPAEAPRP